MRARIAGRRTPRPGPRGRGSARRRTRERRSRRRPRRCRTRPWRRPGRRASGSAARVRARRKVEDAARAPAGRACRAPRGCTAARSPRHMRMRPSCPRTSGRSARSSCRSRSRPPAPSSASISRGPARSVSVRIPTNRESSTTSDEPARRSHASPRQPRPAGRRAPADGSSVAAISDRGARRGHLSRDGAHDVVIRDAPRPAVRSLSSTGIGSQPLAHRSRAASATLGRRQARDTRRSSRPRPSPRDRDAARAGLSLVAIDPDATRPGRAPMCAQVRGDGYDRLGGGVLDASESACTRCSDGRSRISRVARAGARRPAGRDRARRGQPLLRRRRRRPVPLRAGGGQLRAGRSAGPGSAAAGPRLLLRGATFPLRSRTRVSARPVQPGRLPDREPRGIQRPAPHDRHLQCDRRRIVD